jgi:hypothetical protein
MADTFTGSLKISLSQNALEVKAGLKRADTKT